MMPLAAIRAAQRRTRIALRRFHVRRWLPDLGDIAIVAGMLIIGHVFYQITPMIGEAYLGTVLCLIGVLRMFTVGRR